MPSKKFATSFSFLTLHVVNLLLPKKKISLVPFKINLVGKPSTLSTVFLMVWLRFPTKWSKLEVSLQAQNFEIFHFFDINPPKKSLLEPPLITSTYLEKKGIPIAFRQVLPKNLPVAYIFCHKILTNLKKLIGTKSLDTNQCSAGLSPRIIHHYSAKPSCEALRMEENPSQEQRSYQFSLSK